MLPNSIELMQVRQIQLPPGDFIDLWAFSRLIARAVCPSLRDGGEYSWLTEKVERVAGSGLVTRSNLSEDEKRTLLKLLPELPPKAGIPMERREHILNTYRDHPERLPWTPVLVSEEEVAANGFRILRIQERHLRTLQVEVSAGLMRAFDSDHIQQTNVGHGTYIRREDAADYLTRHHFDYAKAEPQVARRREPGGSQFLVPPHRRPPSSSCVAAGTNSLAKCDAATKGQKKPAALAVSGVDETASLLPPRQNASCRDGNAQDPSQIIMKRKQVEQRTSLSRSAIYDKLSPNSPRHDPTFPKQVKLGAASVGWLKSEIDAWLASRARAGR